MRIFGENIGIVAGDSSSLATGSIALGDTFKELTFFIVMDFIQVPLILDH